MPPPRPRMLAERGAVTDIADRPLAPIDPADDGRPAIEATNLTKRYGAKVAVDKLSLRSTQILPALWR